MVTLKGPGIHSLRVSTKAKQHVQARLPDTLMNECNQSIRS